MTRIIDGKKLAEEIRGEVSAEAARLAGGPPCLAAVLVGEDPASRIYVRSKRRACEKAGLRSVLVEREDTITQAELLAEVDRLNSDPEVHGILVQLPLPPSCDPQRIAEALDPAKDVDGLHPMNVGRLVAGAPGIVPNTPLGILEILDRNGIEIEGRSAVVIGRSDIVGKPVAFLLLHRHATVTLCHSRTRDLAERVRQADIVVAAVGRPRLVKGDWIKPGAAVIDVGVNRVDGKLVGDVDFEGANGRAGLLTPVPGGVGPLTIAMVLKNTVNAFKLQRGAGPG